MNPTNQAPQAPSLATHVPVKVDLPDEDTELSVGRDDLPTPSLWQRSVEAKHKITGRRAVVARVDWATNMFRAFYPDEGDPGPDGKPTGRFAERTEWEHCRDWDVAVTWSPQELERQAAQRKLQGEIATLDPKSLAAVSVLCDDTDPVKALAKLEALRQLGVVKTSAEAAQMAVAEVKKGSK